MIDRVDFIVVCSPPSPGYDGGNFPGPVAPSAFDRAGFPAEGMAWKLEPRAPEDRPAD